MPVGQSRFDLREGENVIGRDSTASVKIESPCVSRRHAIIAVDDEHATVADLGSRNGTFVGKQRIRSTIALANGDVIQFGCAGASFIIQPAASEDGAFEVGRVDIDDHSSASRASRILSASP